MARSSYGKSAFHEPANQASPAQSEPGLRLIRPAPTQRFDSRLYAFHFTWARKERFDIRFRVVSRCQRYNDAIPTVKHS